MKKMICPFFLSNWHSLTENESWAVVCRLHGTEPLPEPMRIYCQIDIHISTKCSTFKQLLSRKCIWKYRLQNDSHFVQTESYLVADYVLWTPAIYWYPWLWDFFFFYIAAHRELKFLHYSEIWLCTYFLSAISNPITFEVIIRLVLFLYCVSMCL